MNLVNRMGRSKAAAWFATMLHALVLLAAIIVLPGDPLLSGSGNVASFQIADLGPDGEPETASLVDACANQPVSGHHFDERGRPVGPHGEASIHARFCGLHFQARAPPPKTI